MGLLKKEHLTKLGVPIQGVNLSRIDKLKDDCNALIKDLHANEYVVEDFIELKMEVYEVVMTLGTLTARIDLFKRAIASIEEARGTLLE